ncbi:MAG: T9SS type A sorting domain-containing protein [Chitinophagaceae bacterium]|nr:T9SS type A sorting domain-containing protein [Chitinophagaceae bacterium]MBP6476921.1 T9SS type A sorting domain-containing protein [Chitinophagaceae bacterium]MBP7106988.1 T9SS type A sorting domain-containing protein [Chitinophagaceae bacterium]MBP7314165.1 T9SS type A sorting domain-containing protein [Chitinophagaceae bacterium]HQX95470.1 T9SS type A sorting domain-containing protein [Chitinophagaceae bacterium]
MLRYLITLVLAIAGFIAQTQEVLYLSNGSNITITPGAILTVQGGLQMANGSSISNDGNLYINNNSISNQSNWTDNNVTGVFSALSTGMVYFQSANGHTITGNTIFPSLTLDAVNGGATINNSISIANNLILKNGKFNTGSFQLIALNNAANAVQADVANTNYAISWVNGNLRRSITSNTGTYDFPVGNATQSNLLQFVNANITGSSFLTASFGTKPGNDVGLLVSEMGTSYTSVNTGGVWYLTADMQPAGGTYALKLYFNNFIGLTDNAFGILKRSDASSNAADWQVPVMSVLPAAGTAGRIVSAGYTRRNNIGSFSQFGIGMTSFPLPVKLVEFNARRIDEKTVLLNWETAQEYNNKGFEIERRLSNESLFSQIGFVPSRAFGGNSTTTLDYSYNDFNNFVGDSYYRLKQVDLDNRFEYSKIVKVNLAKSNQLQLYPNPAATYTLLVFTKPSKKVIATILSSTGQLIKTIVIADGQNQQNINVEFLPRGEYTIRVTSNEINETLKFLKQ